MITEAHLDEILHIKSDINYWQELAAKARTLPLIHGMWLEGEGEAEVTRYMHLELNLDPVECHRLMIDGIATHAEKQIAILRDRLKRKGIIVNDQPAGLPPPDKMLQITHVQAEAPPVPKPPARKKRRAA